MIKIKSLIKNLLLIIICNSYYGVESVINTESFLNQTEQKKPLNDEELQLIINNLNESFTLNKETILCHVDIKDSTFSFNLNRNIIFTSNDFYYLLDNRKQVAIILKKHCCIKEQYYCDYNRLVQKNLVVTIRESGGMRCNNLNIYPLKDKTNNTKYILYNEVSPNFFLRRKQFKTIEKYFPRINTMLDEILQSGNVKINLDLDFNEFKNNQYNKIDFTYYRLSSLNPMYNEFLNYFYAVSYDYSIYQYESYNDVDREENNMFKDKKNSYDYDKTLDDVILRLNIYLNINKLEDLLKILNIEIEIEIEKQIFQFICPQIIYKELVLKINNEKLIVYDVDTIISTNTKNPWEIYDLRMFQYFVENNCYEELDKDAPISQRHVTNYLKNKYKNVINKIKYVQFICQDMNKKLFLMGTQVPIKEENITFDVASYQNAKILFIKELYKKKILFQQENKDVEELDYCESFTEISNALITQGFKEIPDALITLDFEKINLNIIKIKDTIKKITVINNPYICENYIFNIKQEQKEKKKSQQDELNQWKTQEKDFLYNINGYSLSLDNNRILNLTDYGYLLDNKKYVERILNQDYHDSKGELHKGINIEISEYNNLGFHDLSFKIFEKIKDINCKGLSISFEEKFEFYLNNKPLIGLADFFTQLQTTFHTIFQDGNLIIELDLDFTESPNNQFNKLDHIHYKLSSLNTTYDEILKCFYFIGHLNSRDFDYSKIYKYSPRSDDNNLGTNDINKDKNDYYDKTLDEVIFEINIYFNEDKLNDLLKILLIKNFFLCHIINLNLDLQEKLVVLIKNKFTYKRLFIKVNNEKIRMYDVDLIIPKDKKSGFLSIYNFKMLERFFKNCNIYKKLCENSIVSSPDYNDKLVTAHKQKNITEMINKLEFITNNISIDNHSINNQFLMGIYIPIKIKSIGNQFLMGTYIPIKEENIKLDLITENLYKEACSLFINELYIKKTLFIEANQDNENYKQFQATKDFKYYKKFIEDYKDNKDYKKLNYSYLFRLISDNLIEEINEGKANKEQAPNKTLTLWKNTIQDVKEKHKEKRMFFEQQLEFNDFTSKFNNEEEVKENFKDNV